MARTRTTIRRIDPWSILKFGFVANVVLLGIQLLAGAVLWYVIQRLELIQTVCELAGSVGFEECGVDGGALFDTFLVLGLLGVVVQTGILVFLSFLANLIFDLTGGIVLTLEDDRPSGSRSGGGVGARAVGASGVGTTSDGSRSRPPAGASRSVGDTVGSGPSRQRSDDRTQQLAAEAPRTRSGDGRSGSGSDGRRRSSTRPVRTSSGGDDEKLFRDR